MRIKRNDWIDPITLSPGKLPLIKSNKYFPRMPPAEAPIANNVVFLISIFTSVFLLLISDTADIARTVHPDIKLMVDTSSPEAASITGLMMTPPPIPLMAPAVVANKHIAKINI